MTTFEVFMDIVCNNLCAVVVSVCSNLYVYLPLFYDKLCVNDILFIGNLYVLIENAICFLCLQPKNCGLEKGKCLT